MTLALLAAPSAQAALSSCANYDEDAGKVSGSSKSVTGAPGNACGQCEPKLLNAIDGPGGLIEQAKNGQLKSVEEFMAALAKDKYGKTMLGNSILINNSRSAQATNTAQGGFRYMMKSRESDVAIGVTNAKGQKGYNTLEFVLWNGKEGRYEMRSLCFPGEGACANDQGQPVGATEKPQVHGAGDKPPESCIQCHNNPPRPNWDTYRFWSGSIPMNPDRLVFPSEEATWYVKTMKDNANDPRMKYLKPPIAHSGGGFGGSSSKYDLAQMEALLASSTDPAKPTILQLEHDPQANVSGFGPAEDPPSVRFFDQSNFRNTCRIATEQKKLPTKYAFLGAMKGCGPNQVADFIPPDKQVRVADYFNSKGIGADGKVTEADILKDTWKRNNQHYIKKLVLQLDTMISRFKGDQKKAEAELGYTADALSALWAETNDPAGKWQSSSLNGGAVKSKSAFPADAPAKSYASIPSNQVDGRDVELMAKTRLLLEPMGVPVDQWSLSVDFGKPQLGDKKFFTDDTYGNKTFSFADIYKRYMDDAPMFLENPESELTKECKADKAVPCDPNKLCEWLGKKSVAALRPVKLDPIPGAPVRIDFVQFKKDCRAQGEVSGDLVPPGIKVASAVNRSILKEMARKTYEKCMDCHDGGIASPDQKKKDAGRTNAFPKFDDLRAMKRFLMESPVMEKKGDQLFYSGRTWLETMAIATDPSHRNDPALKSVPMMPEGMSDLKPDERAVFLGYLTSLDLANDTYYETGTAKQYACEMLADRLTGKAIVTKDGVIDSSGVGAGGAGGGYFDPDDDCPKKTGSPCIR